MTFDLFFNNYKMVYIDRSNYIFSESLLQEESVGMVFEYIEATFEFDPVQNISWPPGFLYRMRPSSNMKY